VAYELSIVSEGVLKVSDVVDYPAPRGDQQPFVGIYSHKIAVNACSMGPWTRFETQLGLLKHSLRELFGS